MSKASAKGILPISGTKCNLPFDALKQARSVRDFNCCETQLTL